MSSSLQNVVEKLVYVCDAFRVTRVDFSVLFLLSLFPPRFALFFNLVLLSSSSKTRSCLKLLSFSLIRSSSAHKLQSSLNILVCTLNEAPLSRNTKIYFLVSKLLY